ncbi:GTPase IMAP family member 8 [Labeo rohita]|uniref:GTPase IMAP family member 8 n=1 Tax=Labeo rohita TaxID=84645 RepID=A0ABQ8MVR3_LABRO|nr:GTPase IMAP family member 8 [Labeo rohita]
MSENNRVGNLIFDKDVFGKTTQLDVETMSESVEGRNITVINTTHLLDPDLTLQQMAHNVSKISPLEPYVIILVLQHNDFTKKNRDRLPSLLNCFAEHAMKRTMILTTDDKKRYTKHRSESDYIQEISTECGGGCFQLTQTTRQSQILRKMDKIISHGVVKETQQVTSLHEEYSMSDLRIILLGKDVSENSRVRNSILGIDMCESDVPTKQHNMTMIGGKMKDRHITVINTLHLLDQNISNHQIEQTVRECVYVSAPGPHAFIIIQQYKNLTQEDMRRVNFVLKKFSEEAIKRTIVLMTDKGTMSQTHTVTYQFIKECGGGHMEFEKENPEWQSDIFKTVDKIIQDCQEKYLTCDIYEDVKGTSVYEEQSQSHGSVRSEEKNKECSYYKDDGKPEQSERNEESPMSSNFSGKKKLNLVLCGSDSTINVSVSKLLRGKYTKHSHHRESTEECVKKKHKIHGRLIHLVELPVLNLLSEEEVMRQTLHCVSLCDPGVHVFLIIIPAGPLTDGDKAEIEKIQKIFYSREHFIVMFIKDVTVKRPVTNFIKSSTECQRLISRCGGRYCVMALKEHDDSQQIPELLDYIENMKTEPYSQQTYVKAQKNRVRHQTEEKYEEKLKKMEDKIKDLKQKIQSGESCSHFRVMAARVLERWIRVAASSEDDLVLSAVPSSAKGAHPSPLRHTPSWGDIMDSESPEFTLLFDQQLLAEGNEVEGDEEEDEEMLARLLQD